MVSDNAYHAKCVPSALLLLEASNGDPSAIPEHYLNSFEHTFADGDISLVPKISSFDNFQALEYEEVVEVLEDLSKISPETIPNPDDILRINLLRYFDEHEPETQNFAEDNLSLSYKVERCLSSCIESVLGGKVENIRDCKGKYPSEENNFLCKGDGTFSGTFSCGELTFLFEIAPTREGWICTYRLGEKSLDSTPQSVEKRAPERRVKSRKVRSVGWLS